MREAKGKREIELLQDAYRRWERSDDNDLHDVYSSISESKHRAMDYCRYLMYDMNGWGLKILSHNTYCFTVGFEFSDKETGELCFAYITKSYDRYIKL